MTRQWWFPTIFSSDMTNDNGGSCQFFLEIWQKPVASRLILVTLSKAIQARLVVKNPKTAKKAWDILAEIFGDNKRSRLGLPLSKDDIANIALEGLPDKYENVSGIIIHWEPFPDLKMVCSMLTMEEMRLKSRAQATSVDSTSLSLIILLANSDMQGGSTNGVNGNNSLRLSSNTRPTPNMTPKQMMALIQQQQNMLAQFRYTRNTNSTMHASSRNANIHLTTPMAFNTGPAQTTWFSTIFVQNSNPIGQPGSNPAGHETLLPNAFNAMTLQDPNPSN
ncbi:hypothetical protein Tco_0127009 [Tanacetum coccineum]